MKVLLFAGTKNGRVLAQKLIDRGVSVVISSMTAHGNDLLPNHQLLDRRFGPMTEVSIASLIWSEAIEAVVDATHPYAEEISHNIIHACRETGCRLYRLDRQPGFDPMEGRHFASMEEACRFLGSVKGNVLLTTGSNQVDVAVRFIERERIIVRLLPVDNSVKKATDCGLPMDRILAMTPPFGVAENLAHIREHHIDYLLTKDGGVIGGTMAKAEAVREARIELVVIDRPVLDYESVYYEDKTLISDLLGDTEDRRRNGKEHHVSRDRLNGR